MKITICCKRFGPSGGAEAFLANFVRCLLADGHRVRVLAAELTGEVEGVECVPLRVKWAPGPLKELALAGAAADALARERADVTFSDQRCWGARVVRPGGGVQRVYVRQWIRTFRHPAVRFLKRAQYALSVRERLRIHIDDELYGAPGPELVIANSDMVRRDLVHCYPHLEGRVRVVYNGADPQRFHPGLREEHRARVRGELGIPQNAMVGVFVGTGWRRKGLATFIEALGILERGEAQWPTFGIVVGRGNARAAMRHGRLCGTEGVLRIVGQQPPEPYYAAADLLVLPTYFDPCANVTLEALACGLPVITTVWNGAHELLEPGVSGFAVEDPANAQHVAAFMRHFMDEGRLARASEAARALALEHTLERQYREMMDAITPLAGR